MIFAETYPQRRNIVRMCLTLRSPTLKMTEKESVGEKLNKREESILELIRTNPHITIEQLSVLSGVSTRTVERNIRSLKKKEYLERNGSDVKGEWIVKK